MSKNTPVIISSSFSISAMS